MKTTSKITEVTNPWFRVSIYETIEIGSIVVEICNYCDVHYNNDKKLVVSADDWEIHKLEYQGIQISTYQNIQKFKQFHKEMGIDLDDKITSLSVDDATESVINKYGEDVLKKLLM
jgi:hypothetical protein